MIKNTKNENPTKEDSENEKSDNENLRIKTSENGKSETNQTFVERTHS